MRRFCSAVLLMLVMVMTGTSVGAVAKNKPHKRVPFVIAGVQDSRSQIVKVMELPDVPMLRRNDGAYVDLGYRWGDAGLSEWIGYIGSDSEYVPLTPALRETVMMAAGIEQMPQPPQRPVSMSFNFNPWPFVIVLGVAFALWKAFSAMRLVVGEVRQPTEEVEKGTGPQFKIIEAVAPAPKPKMQMPSEGFSLFAGVFAARQRQAAAPRNKFGRR